MSAQQRTDAERALRLREQATRLRALADDLTSEAVMLERNAWGPNPLRGRDIADVAAEVLAEAGPTHYRVLTARVVDRAGRRISGKEPEATLLATIFRDERFESMGGSRSGVYGLREAAAA